MRNLHVWMLLYKLCRIKPTPSAVDPSPGIQDVIIARRPGYYSAYLDLADMINNTISGSLALKYGPLDQVLTKGQCTANAWLTLTVLQGFTALGLQAYGPVGGNWCWIQAKYPILRWSLSFGWRLCIFFLVMGIYTTVYFQLKRTFGRFGVSGASSDGTNITTTDTALCNQHATTPAWPPIMKVSSLTVAYELGTVNDAASSSSTAPMSNQAHCYSNPEPDSSNASAAAIRQPAWNRALPNLRRMMLLNGYPLGYLILWTPGVVNRFIEIKGKSPPWLVAFLASTQYIGLVHAITYGYNEQFRRSIQSWKVFRQRRERIED
ncbi:hypothetical protein FOXG_15876 [Fusarium oxysporum f. sp. lycopersici 4287]|uniref:Uncharacterized protein n=1 Tax=Fusarium oxysporum f. sp. lycopersici (strain 4287 / CBS 123668 / FGSC 9935 / NRRL 34936) TaxID=426428 RepID=A0A0J9WUV7_FUSO4|nr:hypothetical protein FOXG_15876 [Fusarium oxysporum f. sp. lycopersici 4287]KNB18452.1 hypothetical protein FOXG_15876 [Fusarium oxysporum f. sp. lycopersici 4287]